MVNIDKIAITAIEVYSDSWEGLEAFDRAIYNNELSQPEPTATPISAEQALSRVIGRVVSELNPAEVSRAALLLATDGLLDNRQVAELTTALNFSGKVLMIGDTPPLGWALASAQAMLTGGEVSLVILAAVGSHHPHLAAAAICLKPAHSAGKRVYATLAALSQAKTPDVIVQTCKQAYNAASIAPEKVGLLELAGDNSPLTELAQVYNSDTAAMTCAVTASGLKFGAANGLLSLIKVALCLYHRYIPASPAGADLTDHPAWQNSRFYLADKARSWFVGKDQPRRTAALSLPEPDGTYTHLLLTEGPPPPVQPAVNLESDSLRLILLSATDLNGFLEHLGLLENRLVTADRLDGLAREYFQRYQTRSDLPYRLVLACHNLAELSQEIEKARVGLAKAFARGQEWHTPQGSYFTPRPLGEKAEIAFVYPGGFNSYPGLGQDLFRLFPGLYDSFARRSAHLNRWLAEPLLYPRSKQPLTPARLEAFEEKLAEDTGSMILSGAGFAVLFTELMRKYFKLKPAAAFGYSLGEASMLWALGVWDDFDGAVETFDHSDVFRTRLTGPKATIRELWDLPASLDDEAFWSTYFVLAPVEQVQTALQEEPRVYLTHVNTAEEVIISGEKAGCQRVIERLKCHYLRRPHSFVLHCAPAQAEFNQLVRLNLRPVRAVTGIKFYSAAEYTTLKLETEELARRNAEMTCQPVDFPRLLDRVYGDGARVFIELGPGNTCTRWINKNLKDRPHLALSLNQKGVRDGDDIMRALAKLVSHGVALDLSLLFTASTPAPATTGLNSAAQLGKMGQNATRLAEVHANFLANRQQALGQLTRLINLQMNLLEQAGSAGTAAPTVERPTNLAKPQVVTRVPAALFDQQQIAEFASGSVVKCFGPDFAGCDDRRVPRIPNGDLMLISRITAISGQRRDFEGFSTIEAEYDVPLTPWFCPPNANPGIPYSILMEIALQPCGFLSAYKGSFLLFPDKDLYFRNLDGQATLLHELDLRGQTITTRARLLSTAVFEGTIIQRFEFECEANKQVFYKGSSAFGFFTRETMLKQVGLDNGKQVSPWLEQAANLGLPVAKFDLAAPSVRQKLYKALPEKPFYHLAAGQLDLLDEVVIVPGGGRFGAGYIYARRKINPADWFYKCHFYQDAVMPGSLGVEAMHQAMKVYALTQNLEAGLESPRFGQTANQTVNWKYRGQITPDNQQMQLEIHLKPAETTARQITLSGEASLWKDNLRIYEVKPLALAVYAAAEATLTRSALGKSLV